MLTTSLVLILVWLITLIYAQYKHTNVGNWTETPISNFIKYSVELQVGFVSLALGLLLAGIHFGGVPELLFAISAAGSLGVMYTKNSINSIPHGVAAVLTYLCALSACVIIAHDYNNGVLLGMAISNILYIAFAGVIQDEVADIERYQALGLIVWLVTAKFMIV